MNKEEMEKIVNDINDALWHLKNNECNIDTKENSWETYYGLNDELIRYIRKIEQENKQLKEDYAKLINDNCYVLKLEQENEQLKNNWNKLKKELKETVERDDYSPYDGYDWQDILDKMQELEKGDNK